MTKYKEYFTKMVDENSDVFESFRELHERYKNNSASQEEYNESGKYIMNLIREYEDRLCKTTEGGGYSAYSGNLAEKFWEEVRREFPLIDRVGIIIKKVAVDTPAVEEEFELKKIETFSLRKISLSSN